MPREIIVMIKVYCAGPLFNAPEREEMQQIASTLEQSGFNVFLPQTGFIMNTFPFLEEKGFSRGQIRKILRKAIFSVDLHELLENCDAIVANLNGRVLDEGTIAETAIAWHAGKTVVLYKNDERSTFDGIDNPLVSGLGNFSFTNKIEYLPNILKQEFEIKSNGKIRYEKIKALSTEIHKKKNNIPELADFLLNSHAEDIFS